MKYIYWNTTGSAGTVPHKRTYDGNTTEINVRDEEFGFISNGKSSNMTPMHHDDGLKLFDDILEVQFSKDPELLMIKVTYDPAIRLPEIELLYRIDFIGNWVSYRTYNKIADSPLKKDQ